MLPSRRFRKVQAAIGDYDELLTMVKKLKTKMVWPYLKVLSFSKNIVSGKRRDRQKKAGRQYQRVDRDGLWQLKWKGVVAKSSVVPRDLPELWDNRGGGGRPAPPPNNLRGGANIPFAPPP